MDFITDIVSLFLNAPKSDQSQVQVQIHQQKVQQKQDLYLLTKSLANFLCSLESLILIERKDLTSRERIFIEYDYFDFVTKKNFQEILEQAETQLFIFKTSLKGFQHTWDSKFTFPSDFSEEQLMSFLKEYYPQMSLKLKEMTEDLIQLLSPEYLTEFEKLIPKGYLPLKYILFGGIPGYDKEKNRGIMIPYWFKQKFIYKSPISLPLIYENILKWYKHYILNLSKVIL